MRTKISLPVLILLSVIALGILLAIGASRRERSSGALSNCAIASQNELKLLLQTGTST